MTESLPAPRSGRDQRVDFYRGIALAMIFVNHIPGNLWENFTTRNFGFSDSAELFVFLAGFASAFAYARPFLNGQPIVASLKAWRRAGVLYLVHMTLTMFAIALFAWAALAFGDGRYMEVNELKPLLTDPLNTLIGLITLGHQLKFVNILPMYSALLLMLPVHLFLAARLGRTGMLAVAIGLWLVTARWSLNVPNHPYTGGWFFNPFAWQLILAIGLWCGLARWQRGYSVPYSRPLYIACLLYLLACFVFVDLDLWGLEKQFGLPFLVAEFDKTYVTLPRLLHVLALIYVFAHAPKSSPVGAVSRDNPFTMLGRHSLPVFAVGTALSLVAQVVKFGDPPSALRDSVIVLTGLGLQFALARYLDWWGTAKARKVQPATAAPAPTVTAEARTPPYPRAAGGSVRP